MSNGDDEPADAPEEASSDQDPAEETPEEELPVEEPAAPALPEDVTEESLNEYLDGIAESLEAAETEADLDDVEALLDDAEAALAGADLPEPDEDDEDDEDAEAPRESLQARIDALREDLEAARGPYASDVVADIESAVTTVEETEWTERGTDEVGSAVQTFAVDVAEATGADVTVETQDEAAVVASLKTLADVVTNADLHADEDAGTLAALVEATDDLEAALEDAEEWDDLETHEQLQAQGYYDVLGHYKDFPVEWSALKVHEKEGNVDMVLLALDSLQSDFMERHCLDALRKMGKRAATDDAIEAMLARAGKRDQPAIRILGKMCAAEATETLVEYVDEDSNPQLQKVVFKALGEIGASEAVQPLADKLEMENEHVRPIAARSLGLIGDTRAVDPLVDVLDGDESDDVRAAAAWALRQIGTRESLEAVAEYADERVYIVQSEAEKAADALAEVARPA